MRRWALAWALALAPLSAQAQGNPGWTFGYVPSVDEWSAAFSAKLDVAAQGQALACALPFSANPNIIARAQICLNNLVDPAVGASQLVNLQINGVVTAGGPTDDHVGLGVRMISAEAVSSLWAINTVSDCLTHSDGSHAGSCAGYEADVDNVDCDAGLSPGSNSACPTWSKGLWLTGLANNPVTDALLITAQNFAKPQWHYGVRAAGASIDTAFLYDTTNAVTSFYAAGTHSYGLDFSTALFELPGQAPGTGAALRLAHEQYTCFQPDCVYKQGYSGVLNGPGFLYGNGTQSVIFPSDGGVYASGPGIFSTLYSKGAVVVGYNSSVGFAKTDGSVGIALTLDPVTLGLDIGNALSLSAGVWIQGQLAESICPGSAAGLTHGQHWCDSANGYTMHWVP